MSVRERGAAGAAGEVAGGGRRAAWAGRAATLGDQVVSSLSNVLAVVLVARALDADGFGRFSLAYTALTVTLGLCRAQWGTRISLTASPDDARRLTLALAGAAVAVAPLAVAAILAVSAISTGLTAGLDAWPVLLVVACAAPVVCVQDLLRFGAAAAGRPGVALASDGVWLALVLLPFLAGARPSAAAALALWLAAAVAALAVALAGFRGLPRIRPGLAELRRRHPVGDSVAAGALAITAGTMWLALCASWLVGPAAAGSLRGAATALGPVNVLVAFVGLGLTPALVRRRRSGDLAFCALTAAALAALTALWCAVLLLLPAALGRAAFGDSWAGIRAVLPWTTVEYLALGATTAAVLGLKARHRARDLLRLRVGGAAAAVAAGTALAVALRDVRAVSAAVALVAVAGAACGWLLLARSPAGGPSSGPADPVPAGEFAGGVRHGA